MIDYKVLPVDSGCYLFKDSVGSIIYVGKAKSLRKRVGSYFTKKHADEKTRMLVRSIVDLDFFVTSNEVEALILENNLIKKHKPKYNIDLKDSKRYAYLLLTDERFPRLIMVRDKNKGGEYFGPFTSGEYRKLVRKLLVNTFGIRTCNKLPKKACLRYHINLCTAPCENKISEKNYEELVVSVRRFLKGDTSKLIKELIKDMKSFSDELDFENAKTIRDQLKAVEYLDVKQKMELTKSYDENVINYVIKDDMVYLIVFNIHKGMLVNKSEFSFDYETNFLESFISMYYSEYPVPEHIILPKSVNDESIVQYLRRVKGSKVSFIVPKIGVKFELLDLVKRNVEASFLKQDLMISSLRKELNLNFTPSVIETFDVSHLGGTDVVGSCVRFSNAKPDKSNYRRFKMKTYQSNDDFRGIYELVTRRYKRLNEQGLDFPDLVVVDGGMGQLNAGLKALKDLGLKIPIISLAKKHEEVFIPGSSKGLRISKKSPGLNLLIQGRNEAHRFAIKYQKLLRSRRK